MVVIPGGDDETAHAMSAASAPAATDDDKGDSVRWDRVLPRASVPWDRFLPRASMRVLLVESDQCTREIISALLTKCGYHVYSASDGLKAWEALKANSQEVDLVLTEVELPSLSGLDLLTLIMDHDICRNIPVVMMSTSDSITTAFKCMRKGASDFLVKPIRKNELRILWQHVWRRYSSSGELGLANRSGDVHMIGQKSEANSDNNATSNNLHEYGAGAKHKECDEKETDTQSSSTRPSRDVVSSLLKNMQEQDQDNIQSSSIGKDSKGSEIITGSEITTESNQHNSDGVKSSSEVIDLLGVMKNILQDVQTLKKGYSGEGNTSADRNNFVNGDNSTSHKTSAPHLELSLGGYESQHCVSPGSAGCNVLNHSNSSAFSRYSGKTVSPKSVNLGEKQEECFGKPTHIDQMKIQFPGEETTSTITSCCNQNGDPIQLQTPVETLNGVATTCDQQKSRFATSMIPNICTQQGDPPWRKQPVTHKVIPIRYPSQSNTEVISIAHSQQIFHEPTNQHLTCQTETENIKNLEPNESRHLSVIDKSGSNSMCSSNRPYISSNNFQDVCNGLNVNLNGKNSTNSMAACTQDNFQLTDGQCSTTNLQRSIRREAALTKFRLKRKDRCYEKKVRYHSRQKLAEQRPRVKGQFVRKVQPDNANGSG